MNAGAVVAKKRKSPSRKTTRKPARKPRKAAAPAPRKRDFKAEYQKRIAKALAAGKTKQAGRGHKVKEHIIRKEREREEAGVSSSELRSIRSFLKRFNPIGFKDIPDEETLVEFVQEQGYPAFQKYRGVWDETRRKYVAEKKDGSWESRGLGYLNDRTGLAGAPEPEWLYYH